MKTIILAILMLLGIVVKSQTWHQLFLENNIPESSVVQVVTDLNGKTWVATSSSGIYVFDNNGYTHITTANGILSNTVRAITCDVYGRIWIGFGIGISCWNNGQVTNYNTQTGMQSASVWALTTDSSGKVWIGTNIGLIRFDGNSFVIYTTLEGLVSNSIRVLDFDGTNLWVGTIAGLSKFDGISFTNYTTSNGLPANTIKTIFCSSLSEVWIGTLNGAVRYNGTSFDLFGTLQGIASDTVIAISKDFTGNVWFCSNDVITRMNGTNFTYFTPVDFSKYLLSSPVIKCISCYGDDVFIGTSLDCIKTRVWTVKNIKEAFIETANVKIGVNNQGSIIPATVPIELGLEFPKDSGIYTIFTSNIWLAGLDPAQNLHLAVCDYNMPDYYSGPYSAGGNYDNTYDSLYNRIWVISKAEVDFHRNNWNQSGYIMPEVIKNWPAPSALYVDLNSNFIYEPDLGDYPEIRGDRAILCLYNDDRLAHIPGSEELKLEMAILYYVYDTLIESVSHTIFVNINITNMNSYPFHEFYMGIQSDIDIGYAVDDYVGCDSILSCYYIYNAKNNDSYYLNNIPAQGIVFLSSPLYSFSYYTNTSVNVMADPHFPMDYYYNLRGFWKDGTPYTYGGNGYGGTSASRYVFNGDPVSGTGWTEANALNPWGDRRALGSIGPFTLDPGKSKCIDFAYVTGRHSSGDNLLSVNTMKSYVTEILQLYNMSSFYCDTIHINTTSEVDIVCDSIKACKDVPVEIHPFVSGLYWPMTYSWSPAAGLSDPTIVNPIATVSASTTYNVTVTDAQGNTDTESVIISVSHPLLVLDSLYEMCSGGRITLPPASWSEWSMSTWTGGWYDFYNSGNYWARIRDDYGCWSDTAFFTVDILPSPAPDLGATVILCSDESVVLNPGTFYSYYWNNGATTSDLNVSADTMAIANYLYTVTVTNSIGCSASDYVVVKVLDCVLSETYGAANNIYAFPNPFDDFIQIVSDKSETGPYILELFDATGRKVYATKSMSPELHVKGLSPGYYLLKYKSDTSVSLFRMVKTE